MKSSPIPERHREYFILVLLQLKLTYFGNDVCSYEVIDFNADAQRML